MGESFEYKFVRLGQYWGSAVFGVQDKARESYEKLVHKHARDGWRLVQIFAPGTAAFGAARYYDLIFERKTVDAEPHAEPSGNGVATEPRTLVAS